MKAGRASALMLLAACVLPVAARAQTTRLTVSGFPVAFASPTASDFTAGFIQSGSALLFTVDARTGTTGQRTTNVYIRCANPCPSTGTKPRADLQWSRADLGTWNTITTTNALVETRLQFRGGSNDPWSNSIYFRFLLDWLSDPPSATTNSYNIIMTLTVTVP